MGEVEGGAQGDVAQAGGLQGKHRESPQHHAQHQALDAQHARQQRGPRGEVLKQNRLMAGVRTLTYRAHPVEGWDAEG